MTTDPAASFRRLLKSLNDAEVEFILIGGLAAIVHGTARVTYDVDVVYSRSDENIQRVVQCLEGHHPYLRGVPEGLPFVWDENTVRAGLNFALTTELGDIDFLGEVAGGGNYSQLLPDSEEMTVLGFTCRCVTLPKLIVLKRAAGRPKDLEVVAELQALLEETESE